MSHMFEVGLEPHGVNFQSLGLLDGSSPLALLTTGSDGGSYIFGDDGDVFQCGRCKKQFGQMVAFMVHKRGCSSVNRSLVEPPSNSKLPLLHHLHLKDEPVFNVNEYISDEGLLLNSIEECERQFESESLGTISSTQNIHQSHNEQDPPTAAPQDNEDSSDLIGTASVIHMASPIFLGDESLALNIPSDSPLMQFITAGAGSNSPAVIQIPDELAALISSERFHISTSDPVNPMNSHIFLSALPSNLKEPLSEKNFSAGSSEYINVTDHSSGSLFIGGNKNSSEMDMVARLNKSIDSNEETTVLRMRKSVDPSNRENTQQNPKNPSKDRGVVANNATKSKISESAEAKRKCQYCGKPFKKLFNLHQHIRSHTGEKPFHCLVCGRGFTQKSNVKKHMQTHKVWPKIKQTLPKEHISVKVKEGTDQVQASMDVGNSAAVEDSVEYIVNNVYACQYCDQNFDTYHRLKTHLAHNHKEEKLFKCIHKDCMATFMEVEGLISHMKSHEDQIEYHCQSCGSPFTNLYDLGAHQYTHRLHPNKIPTTSVPKQFRCTKCNSKYASAEALNHHLLTSSHNYPCSQCQLTFVCERYLRRHLRIHGTVEPFKCELCGKNFKTENYLKSHLVIHSDSKPFHCEVCKQSFNRRDKLTRHKLMHDNRKKYKCPYKTTNGCEREFYRKDKLKDHMMSHSRKLCTCKCGKTFAWPVRLRNHQAAHHPEMLATTITCSTCQKVFKTKHHLNVHNCKGSETLLQTVAEERIDSNTMNKIVLYNTCEIEDSNNSNEDKCRSGVMLGSFSHGEDSESAILTRYSGSEDLEDVKVMSDVDDNDMGPIGNIGMPFETDHAHIDNLL